MNCSVCRSHFSDFLENALSEIVARELKLHLSRCPRCATDLRDLRVTLERLRNTAAVVPPRGLERAVARRLLAGPFAAGARGEDDLPSDGRPGDGRLGDGVARRADVVHAQMLARRSVASSHLWRWAVAASLLIGVASFLAGRYTAARAYDDIAGELEKMRRALLGVEADAAATRSELARENASLRQNLSTLKNDLEEWRVTYTATLEAERRAQDDLDGRLRRATLELEGQATALSAVEAQLAEALVEKSLLMEELVEARGHLASRRRDAAARATRELRPSEGMAAAASVPFAGSPEGTLLPAAFRDSPPVVCVREGGVLKLVLRGTDSEIFPRLLALAEDETAPEIAALAFATLETRLGPIAADDVFTGSPSREERPALVRWFQRQVDGFSGAEADETDAREADRSAEIDRFRRAWQRQSAPRRESL